MAPGFRTQIIALWLLLQPASAELGDADSYYERRPQGDTY